MELAAFWRRLDRPGHDAARFAPDDSGWRLSGYAAFHEHGPTGLRYEVSLAPDFTTLAARVEGHRSGRPFRHQIRRLREAWTLDGAPVSGVEGLVHLDFGFTPATNLPQLLHADLPLGEGAGIPVAWFDLGTDTLVRLEQDYRRTAPDRYDYRSPAAGYAATLEMAASGFVRRYPGLWEMEPGA